MLAHFRDNKRLTDDQLTALARGTHLRKSDTRELVERLCDMGLVVNVTRKAGTMLRKGVFGDPAS